MCSADTHSYYCRWSVVGIFGTALTKRLGSGWISMALSWDQGLTIDECSRLMQTFPVSLCRALKWRHACVWSNRRRLGTVATKLQEREAGGAVIIGGRHARLLLHVLAPAGCTSMHVVCSSTHQGSPFFHRPGRGVLIGLARYHVRAKRTFPVARPPVVSKRSTSQHTHHSRRPQVIFSRSHEKVHNRKATEKKV